MMTRSQLLPSLGINLILWPRTKSEPCVFFTLHDRNWATESRSRYVCQPSWEFCFFLWFVLVLLKWPCNIHCSVYNICDKTLICLTVNSTSHLRSYKCLKPNKTQCTVAKPSWLLAVAIRISEKPRDASFFTLRHGNFVHYRWMFLHFEKTEKVLMHTAKPLLSRPRSSGLHERKVQNIATILEVVQYFRSL